MPLELPSFPISVVLNERRCLVVGDGMIAERRTRSLLDAGADVTVISPNVSDAISSLPITVVRRSYEKGDAAGYFLVFAASGDGALDTSVCSDAERLGTLANASDDLSHSSFLVPAVVRKGPIAAAVTTDGSSPALAGYLRDQIARLVSDDVAELARLLGAARSRLHGAGLSTEGLPWRELIDTFLADEGQTGDDKWPATVTAFVDACLRGDEPLDKHDG